MQQGQSLKERFQRYICILCECWSSHHLGKETRGIISRLANLTKNLESELGKDSSSSRSSHEDEQQHLLRLELAQEVEPHFVGKETDINLLVSRVTDDKRRERVHKIYGMGGLGKTTLARKIYNHADVQSYARAWVCITQRFEAKTVLGEILKQLDRNAHNNSMGVSHLAEGIYNFLVQRKCLIVIHDIWENDHWLTIKRAFPNNCNVLLTTRFESIANQECQSHKLGFLTEDEGWELLQKIALPQDYGPVETSSQSLEDIGREIVLKCGRLPLSISVIGGILRRKEEDTLAEWKKVNMKMDSYLRHGEGVTQYTRVKQVLDLSYDCLPYYLKPCFLYLACFPEDEEIDTERLYLLWMAEGFISYQDKGRNETLRDVAERYLAELAMRCMVQVHKSEYCSPLRKFDSCRLHDLMHDLCSSKAEKENFVKRIETSRCQNEIPSSIGNSIGRLSITIDSDVAISGIGIEELNDLRSFVLLERYGPYLIIGFKDSTISFDKSQCLRILVLEGCAFEGDSLPSKVGKLIHLRYLSLRSSIVSELPQFVCGMPYLHTLDLQVRDSIRLPNVIWKMKRLRHLFLPRMIEVIGGEKLRLDGLDELETLDEIISETARIADIPKLISLRTLIVAVSDMDSMTIVAHHMSRIRETHLSVGSCDFSSENGREVLKSVLMSPSLVRFSVQNCTMSGGFPYYKQGMCENLVYLAFENCEVGGDVMEQLGKYPMLQILFLREVEMTETVIFRWNSFPQLKLLTLCQLQNLKKWEVEERVMPKLDVLCILECISLEKVPHGLRFISTLQRLTILNMPQEFKVRIRGQDYATVSHIPYLDIR